MPFKACLYLWIMHIMFYLRKSPHCKTHTSKKTIGALTKEFPGYSPTVDDEDPEIERQSRADRDYESKSLCICTMAMDILKQCKMRASESGSEFCATPKLTSAGIKSYNSNLVDVGSIEEMAFKYDQAIRHENCFKLYQLGGFLPPTLIGGFVSDESQIAKRKEILTSDRDAGLTRTSK